MVRNTDSDALYKQQATRLKEFLKRGGHDIQHAHALEAIAAIHGAKDFHTLRHSSKMGDLSATYVVNQWSTGDWVDSAITEDYQLAVACFLQKVRLYSELFPEKIFYVAAVQGGARTEGLHCYMEDALVLSLVQAAVIKPPVGGSRTDPLPVNYVWDDVAKLAYDVTATLATRPYADWETRLRKATHSAIALGLQVDTAGEIFEQVVEIYTDAKIDAKRHIEVKSLLDNLKVTEAMMVVVKEGGVIEL